MATQSSRSGRKRSRLWRRRRRKLARLSPGEFSPDLAIDRALRDVDCCFCVRAALAVEAPAPVLEFGSASQPGDHNDPLCDPACS